MDRDDPPAAVVAAVEQSLRLSTPAHLDSPVEWVRTRAWQWDAAKHEGAPQRFVGWDREIYVIRLRGQFTKLRPRSPRGPGPAVVYSVSEQFVMVEAEGAEAGRVFGGAHGWIIDMAELGRVHTFDYAAAKG